MGLFFGYMDICFCFVGVCKFEVKLYLRWWSFLIYSFKSQCHSSVVLCQHCLMITAGWNEVFIKLRSKAFWDIKAFLNTKVTCTLWFYIISALAYNMKYTMEKSENWQRDAIILIGNNENMKCILQHCVLVFIFDSQCVL